MSLQRWAGGAGIAVAVCAVCGHLPGPLDPTAPPQPHLSAANYVQDPTPSPAPGADQAARDALRTAMTPVPGEDELIAQIHAKYGPTERQPGESGASWCHRQRLMSQAAGADISEMGCQVDDVNYPDAVLSPNAATDWH